MSNDDTSPSGERDVGAREQGYVEEAREARHEEDNTGDVQPDDVAAVATDRGRGWLDDRARLALIVLGVIMVFVPEPVTSMIGLGFIVGGILLWLADLFG